MLAVIVTTLVRRPLASLAALICGLLRLLLREGAIFWAAAEGNAQRSLFAGAWWNDLFVHDFARFLRTLLLPLVIVLMPRLWPVLLRFCIRRRGSQCFGKCAEIGNFPCCLRCGCGWRDFLLRTLPICFDGVAAFAKDSLRCGFRLREWRFFSELLGSIEIALDARVDFGFLLFIEKGALD